MGRRLGLPHQLWRNFSVSERSSRAVSVATKTNVQKKMMKAATCTFFTLQLQRRAAEASTQSTVKPHRLCDTAWEGPQLPSESPDSHCTTTDHKISQQITPDEQLDKETARGFGSDVGVLQASASPTLLYPHVDDNNDGTGG